jgi:Vault protein inter-alpha-trypsin domain
MCLLQTYVNETTNPLEISYSVGIGKRMAVSNFEAQVGDERIVGKIKEAQQAQQIYEDKISEGHTPMLGEVCVNKRDSCIDAWRGCGQER